MKVISKKIIWILSLILICIIAVSCSEKSGRDADTESGEKGGEQVEPIDKTVTVEDELRDFASAVFKSDKGFELNAESRLIVNDDNYSLKCSAMGYYGEKGYNADVDLSLSNAEKTVFGIEIYLRETKIQIGFYSEENGVRSFRKTAADKDYYKISFDGATAIFSDFEPAEWKMVFESYIDNLISEDNEGMSDGLLKKILQTETEEGANGDRYVKKTFDYTDSVGAIYDSLKENRNKTFGEILGENAEWAQKTADTILKEGTTVEDLADLFIAIFSDMYINDEQVSSVKMLCDYVEEKYSYVKAVSTLYGNEIIDKEKRNELEEYEGYYDLLKSVLPLDKDVSEYLPKEEDTEKVKKIASLTFDDIYEVIKGTVKKCEKINVDFSSVDKFFDEFDGLSVGIVGGMFSVNFNGGQLKSLFGAELNLNDADNEKKYSIKLSSSFGFSSKDEQPSLKDI